MTIAGGTLRLAFAACCLAGSAIAEPVTVFTTQSGTLSLTPKDMADAAPLFGAQGPGLAFRLRPEAARAFGELTEASIGQVMSLHVCGDLLIEAVVQMRMVGNGQVALDSLGDANWYAARMRGDEPCDKPAEN